MWFVQVKKGNLGNLEVDLSILQKKYEWSVVLDLKNMLKTIVKSVVQPALKKAAGG